MKFPGSKCGFKNEVAYKQDSVRSYMVCAVGVLCNVITYGSINSFGVIFPALLHEFKQGEAKTAWVGSLAMAMTCVFGPVGGIVNNKFGPRLTGIVGALLSALGLFITSKLKHMGLIFFTYGVIFAFGSSFIYTTIYNVVPKYFLKRRSLATGLISTGPGAGVFVMSQIIEVSLTAFGWRGALMVVGGMLVAMTIPIMIMFSSNVEDSTPIAGRCGGIWVQYVDRSPPPLWRNEPFLVYSISSLMFVLGVMIPQVHMARYCEELGINLAMASRLYLVFGTGSMVSRIVAGLFADHPSINPVYTYQTGLFGAGLSTLLCPLASNFNLLLFYFIAFGIFEGLAGGSLCLLLLSTAHKGQYGKAVGFAVSVQSIGLLSGPPLGGFIFEAIGYYDPVFFSAGSIVLLGWFCIFLYSCLGNKREKESKQHLLNEAFIVVEKETVL